LRASVSSHPSAFTSVAHCERREGVALVPFAEKPGTQLILMRASQVATSPNASVTKNGAHSFTFAQYAFEASSHAASALMVAPASSPEQATSTMATIEADPART
jgi:hypothetical protein